MGGDSPGTQNFSSNGPMSAGDFALVEKRKGVPLGIAERTAFKDTNLWDPDDVPLWRETAAALGKTAPPSPKGTAKQARGTR
jgi:hypothetical protein